MQNLNSPASGGCFLGCPSTRAASASEVDFSRHVQELCDVLILCGLKCSLAGVQHPVKLMKDS